ncbi:hypothetical protein AAKU52_003441, partial [Pedobacter sp. CG_S7]
MYFELYLVTSLRCINDISLMNLSAIPHGCLLYLAIKYAPVYRSFLLRITLP